ALSHPPPGASYVRGTMRRRPRRFGARPPHRERSTASLVRHPRSEMSTDAPLPISPAEGPSLRRRAMRGTLLSVANVLGQQVLRLIGNVITTRLLFPEAYGLMVYVLIVMQGLQMISDVGIIPSIIQHERGEERAFLDTAWTIQILRGTFIAVLALAL